MRDPDPKTVKELVRCTGATLWLRTKRLWRSRAARRTAAALLVLPALFETALYFAHNGAVTGTRT